MAADAGVQRNLQALARRRPDAAGLDVREVGGGWNVHIEGACAELAVAKALGTYWEPVWSCTDDQRGDVDQWHVRSTRRPNGCLIVHDWDPDDGRFVLVISSLPRFRVAGWLLGRECKRDEWWRTSTGRPAFFVPQVALRELAIEGVPA